MASQTDSLGDPANDIQQTVANQNICIGTATASPCPFTVTTRTGNVALIAAILDVDLKAAGPTDDVSTLTRWAYVAGLDVVAGANQTGKALALVPTAMQGNVTVAFGTPVLPNVVGVVGIELGDDGVFALPILLPPTATTLLAPNAAVFGSAARYRFTGISSNTATPAAQSFVLRKHLASTTLDAMDWLGAPTATNVTAATGAWTNVPGATIHSVEYRSGATRALNVTMFDGSTSFTVPAGVTIPTGSLTANVSALGAPGLDLHDFALDSDFDKIVQFASQPVVITP